MWTITLSGKGGSLAPVKAYIDGCPKSGIPAIDFRRRHGLPDAPTNLIELPPCRWEDEAFVREYADRADENANLSGSSDRVGRQTTYGVRDGRLTTSHQDLADWGSRRVDYVILSPEVIRRYLEDPGPATARAVLLDLWAYTARSKALAVAQLCDLSTEAGRAKALEKHYGGDAEALAEACVIVDAAADGVTI